MKIGIWLGLGLVLWTTFSGCAERALGVGDDVVTNDLGVRHDAAVAEAATGLCKPGDAPMLLADDVDSLTATIAVDGDAILYPDNAGRFVRVPRKGGPKSTFSSEAGAVWTLLPDRIDYVYRPGSCQVPDCSALHELDRASGAITILVDGKVPPPSAIAADANDVVVLSFLPGGMTTQIRLHRFRRTTKQWTVFRSLIGPGQGLAIFDRKLSFIDDGKLLQRSLLNDQSPETEIVTPPDGNGAFGFAQRPDGIFVAMAGGSLYEVGPALTPRRITFDPISPGSITFDERDVVTTGWNADPRILAVPRQSGAVRVLAPGKADSRALALDDSCVYFTSGGGSPENVPQHLYRAPR